MTTLTWAALVSTLLRPMAWPLPFRVWPQDLGLGLAHMDVMDVRVLATHWLLPR